MLAALGTLASTFAPQLVSLAAKKLSHSPVGNIIHKLSSNSHVRNAGREFRKAMHAQQ